MTQDRVTREAHNTVQQLMGAEAFELTAASREMVNGAEQIVRQLLRREHAAVVRLVKRAVSVGNVHLLRLHILTALAKRAK